MRRIVNANTRAIAAKIRCCASCRVGSNGEHEGGPHADEIETSMMLYIDPAAVDMTRAVKDYAASAFAPPLTRQPSGRGTYSPTGIWGDPTLATRAKGQVIVEGLVRTMLDDIEALRSAPLPATAAPASTAAVRRPGRGRRANQTAS